MIFTVFCALLYTAIHLQYKDKLYRMIALAPLGCSICFHVIHLIQRYSHNPVTALLSLLGGGYYFVRADNYNDLISYFPIITLGFVVLCILAVVYLCFRESIKSWFCNAFLLLGLASGVIMGFSPTVWASGHRALVFVYFAFIVGILLIYQKLRQLKFKQEPIIFAVLGLVAAASYLDYIVYLYSAYNSSL
jgi:hypothetical protein